jgi:hypothetical protein
MPGLTIRKHADRSDPANPTFAGISLHGYRAGIDPPPDDVRISTNAVAEGVREKWITGEGHEVVTRPAGPADNPWQGDADGRNHEFHHYTALVFHTRDGDVRYRVRHNPDKYADHDAATYPDQVKDFKGTDKTKVTDEVYAAGATRVDHFYDLTKEG